MQKNRIQFTKKEKIWYAIVALLIFAIILATILNVRKNSSEKVENREDLTIEEAEEDENQKLIAALQNMEERERMEYYFGIFLEEIETGKYEKAYSLLYEDFKKTYFPTLDDFKKYLPTVFSEMSNITHDNIERNGDVYVLWITITDAINGKPGQPKEMNIVIQENDYNDFALSFSVI